MNSYMVCSLPNMFQAIRDAFETATSNSEGSDAWDRCSDRIKKGEEYLRWVFPSCQARDAFYNTEGAHVQVASEKCL